MTRRLALLACLCLFPALLPAQEAPRLRGGMVEASGFVHRVTGDFGDWRGGRLRAVLPASRSVFYLETVAQRAFGDDGLYASAAHQLAIGTSWISYLGVGGGTGDFFFPDLRLDAQLTRKLLPSGRLLVSAGGTWVRSKAAFEDRTAVGALTGYLADGVVLEVGGRFNWSNPGDVTSQRGHAALTLGRLGQRYVVVRAGGGSEAYQLTGSGDTERKFNSTEATVTWREWLGPRVGMVLGVEAYDNPFYTRTGAQVGLFVGW